MCFPSTTTSAWLAPDIRAFAAEDPRGFLAQFPDGGIIDEVQRVPELPGVSTAWIIEADVRPGRWILTGSQNLALAESVNQSLAGRTAVHHLLPLTRREVMRFAEHPRTLEEALLAGGYPRIFDQALDPLGVAAFICRHLHRTRRADHEPSRRSRDLSALRGAVRGAHGAADQPFHAGERLRRVAADGAGLARHPGSHALSLSACRQFIGTLANGSSRPPSCTFTTPASPAGSSVSARRSNCARTLCAARYSKPGWSPRSSSIKAEPAEAKRGVSRFTAIGTALRSTWSSSIRSRLTVVEAKSSQTSSASLFQGAMRVQRHLVDASPACDISVVYGGGESQNRAAGRLIPWDRIHEAAT